MPEAVPLSESANRASGWYFLKPSCQYFMRVPICSLPELRMTPEIGWRGR